MLDESASREAVALLSTLIACLFEDADPAIISDLRGPNWRVRARELQAMGGDVAILAAAIGVLAERSGQDRASP